MTVPEPEDLSPTLPTVDSRAAEPECALASLRPGTVLGGRYRVLERLGQGGMGEVYRADDLRLEHPVALKFLSRELRGDAALLSRLLVEVRTARRVSHPNVCRVFDIAEADGHQFLTMELIEGEDLASILRRRPKLPREEALGIARQVCAGLAAAHERQVVHRDLKPANVMVDRHGVVRITDFGLAEAARAVRGARAMEGTPLYMAPEQLERREATARSDIYALGLVLYELVTGTRPFEGDTIEALSAARRRPPVDPSSLDPGIDPGAGGTILRCLAADPERRPASARHVADALSGGAQPAAAVEAAQRRADRIAAFREELDELRASGIVEFDDRALERLERFQAGVLRDLVRDFDVDTSERGRQLSLGMRVVSLVGALAFAASAFYFFYRIWGALSLTAQAGILAAAPAAALVLTAALAATERHGYFTAMAAAFAFTCFVLDVTIVSATLDQLPSPAGYLTFGLFAVIVGFAYRVPLVFGAGVLALATWIATGLVDIAGADFTAVLMRPESFIPSGLLALAAASLVERRGERGMAALTRGVALVLLFGPALILSVAGQLSALPIPHRAVEIAYQAAGTAGSAFFTHLGIRSRKKDLVYVGSALLVLLLFFAFIDWGWEWMPKYVFFLGVALGSVGAALFLKRLREKVAKMGLEAAS